MLRLECWRCSTTYLRPPTPGALPRYCSKACSDAVRAERRHLASEARQAARLQAHQQQREKWLAARSSAFA